MSETWQKCYQSKLLAKQMQAIDIEIYYLTSDAAHNTTSFAFLAGHTSTAHTLFFVDADW